MEAREVCFYCADQNPQRDRSLGITNYTFGLLNALKQSGSVDLHAVVSKSSSGVPKEIPTATLPFRTDHVMGRLIADHFHPALVGGRVNARIWHYPKGFLPCGAQVRPPKVGTIADTILQFYADQYPQQRSRAAYAYWIAMLRNAVRKFDIIITVSEFSKRSILQFADRYQIKEPTVVVTYEGADVPLTSSQRKQDFVLHLASTQPHKRTNWLLRRWNELESRITFCPKLRLIGDIDEHGAALAKKLKSVEVFPAMRRAELIEQMSGALALLFPSEIEGFGLPALEAYYCGTPVVFVKETAVEEVLGSDTAGGFQFDQESFFAALNEALALDASVIARKRDELKQRFSWQYCVQRTLRCYNTLAMSER